MIIQISVFGNLVSEAEVDPERKREINQRLTTRSSRSCSQDVGSSSAIIILHCCVYCLRFCVQAGEEAPYLEDVQPLLSRAETLSVKVPHLSTLESQVAATSKWASRLRRLIPPRPGLTLVEVSHDTVLAVDYMCEGGFSGVLELLDNLKIPPDHLLLDSAPNIGTLLSR
jgi:hypothetical protein